MSKIFDPSDFHIVFAGAKIDGFSEDSMCSFEFDSESFGDVVGVTGEVSRSKNMDRRAKLTIKLMQTSDSNDLFSAVYTSSRLGSNGADIAALRVEDLNGRLVISGPECWIMDTPKAEYGKTASAYEWVIRIANAEAFFGGSD